MGVAGLDRTRILETASDLFVSSGPQAVTMRGLAARIGVTPMALYRHFQNRDELLAAVVEEGHATFLRYLNLSLAEPTPIRRLLGSGEQFRRFALDNKHTYAVMFMEHVPSCSARPEWLTAATFRFLVDRIRDCTAAGDLGPCDAEAEALRIWAQVHGLVSLHLAGKLGLDDAAFEQTYQRSLEAAAAALGWKRPS